MTTITLTLSPAERAPVRRVWPAIRTVDTILQEDGGSREQALAIEAEGCALELSDRGILTLPISKTQDGPVEDLIDYLDNFDAEDFAADMMLGSCTITLSVARKHARRWQKYSQRAAQKIAAVYSHS